MCAVPWYVWCAVAATTSSMVGVLWDISWHRSIGRDTFWTPPHMAIYLCGVLAGLSCGYLILATTFSRTTRATALRDASVRLWGFRGPLGAFIAAWGGIAMLTSAPFDDWWHNAYGLDVKIISPPHTVLAMGMFSVQLGALLLVLGYRNRAEGGARRLLSWLYIYLGGLTVVNMATFIMEHTFRVNMHSGIYYRSAALAIPFFLFAVAGSADVSWPATRIAAMYTLFSQAVNLLLQLFPAEPKLGPVYYPVTHFVPGWFPFLLVIPAAAIDWLWPRMPRVSTWARGAAAGAVFLAVFLAVQWPFGNFLLSRWSMNWFFYSHRYDFRTSARSYNLRNEFFPWERTAAEFWTNLAIAFAAAIVMSALGAMWAGWLRRVRR